MFRKTTLVLAISTLTLASLGLAGCRSGGSQEDLTTSARAYLEKRDQRSAIIQLKNVLGQNPDSVEARALLGKALLLDGEPAAAAVELRKAQDLKAPDNQVVPDLARAMLATGEEAKLIEQFGTVKLSDPAAAADVLVTVATAHALQNNGEKALESATAALQAKPGYAPAIVMVAQLEAAKGRFTEALAELDKVLSKDPTHERAGVLRGDLLWRALRDKDGATKAYRKVLEGHPASMGANTALVAMLSADGKHEEAKLQFAKLKKELPEHPETLYYEAQLAFTDKDYKNSRIITDRLLKVLPENVRVLELAGAAEFRMSQYGPAESFLSRAIKNAPNALLPRQMLAQVFLRTGQPAKALEALQPAINAAQPDGSSLTLAGEAYLQMGKNKEADDTFAAAAKASPNNAKVRTAVAMAQISRGNMAAMADLEALAAGDSNSRADLMLISARQRQGDYAGAMKAIDALEKKQPDRAQAHGLRGQLLFSKGDLAGARRSFETALSKEPTYFAAVAALSSMDMSDGKTDDAKARFKRFLKDNPTSHQAALALAEIAARSGAPVAEVTRLTQEAVKVNPDNVPTRIVLIEQYINSGDPKAALVAAQEALVLMPQNADIMEALGRAQLANGDGTQAVTTFKKLAAVQTSNPRLLIRQAEAQMLTKDNAGAAQSLKRALAIRPDYMPAKRGLLSLAVLDKRYDEGLAIASEIQKASADQDAGWLLEGEVEISRKNYDGAVNAWRKALQKRKSTETAVKIHNALLSGGKRAESERFSADWTKDHPNDAGFRFYLGDMAMARREFAAAETHYRSVLKMQPNNALAMNNVAWLMVQQGKPGAADLAQKAVSLLADRAPLLDTLASALAAENEMGKAIDAQKRAVALSPDNPALRLGLAKHYIKAGEKAYARAELEVLSKLGARFPAQPEVTSLLKSL